ncbi:MAG TPA: Crp/Fnr family transcriptional regulator [Solirubrobacteraceae bacterium]|nr:Crp/Fnr family transcriptional regulator [Solirubrobacteraceae bacterium]
MFAQLVRLLDADPELGDGLDAPARRLAGQALVAEVLHANGGDLANAVPAERRDRALGLLMLDGLVLRRVRLVGRVGVEIVGGGDFVRPWDAEGELASVPAEVAWSVVEPSRFAVVDADLHAVLLRYPDVLLRLVARVSRRADTLALNLALARLPRIESRLIVLFWHLADRFGRVDAEGVVVPLRLSHETLAELVFAQRQSVTRSLSSLADRGLLHRRRWGTWVLHGEPPRSAASLAADLTVAAGD